MRILDSFWTSLVYIFDFTTLSSFGERQPQQQHLLNHAPSSSAAGGLVFTPQVQPVHDTSTLSDHSQPPLYKPPYPPGDEPPPKDIIQCNYTAMGKGWETCNHPGNRSCWLTGPNGQEYNVRTNYEINTPKGVTRKYFLDVTEKALASDGVPMAHGKVFNGSYPGPWSKLQSLFYSLCRPSFSDESCEMSQADSNTP